MTLTTKSVQFKAAASNKNAGLFNDSPVALTVDGFERLKGGPDHLVQNNGQSICTFSGVSLTGMDMASPLVISIDANNGALHLQWEREGASGDRPMATLQSIEDKPISPSGCLGEHGPVAEKRWNVYGRNERASLILRPIKGSLPVERQIELEPGSPVMFEDRGESAVLGSGGEVQLPQVERKIPVGEGQRLVLRGVQSGRMKIEPGAESLKITLRGTSSETIRDGVNEAATSAEYVSSQKPLVKYLSTVSLIGTTILALLNFLKLFKME